MSASLIPTPVMQFFDSNGDPLSGGKVYTYAAGTSTPLATYTDQGGATPNANPVILDSRGEAAIWFGVSSTSSYKIVLKTSADVLIWTADNVTGSLASFAASSGSSLVGFLQAGSGAVARTVQAKERDVVSVKDFGAVGDGATDDSSAINAAIVAANAVGGGTVVFPYTANGYVANARVVLKANVELLGQNRPLLKFTNVSTSGDLSVEGSNSAIRNMKLQIKTAQLVFLNGAIANFTLEGNWLYDTASAWTGIMFHINSASCSNIIVRGNLFDGGSYGALINSSATGSKCIISDNIFTGNKGVNVNALGGFTDVVVANNVLDASNTTGADAFAIDIAHGSKVVVSGNRVIDSLLECIHIEDVSTEVVVIGNVCTTTTSHGLTVTVNAGPNSPANIVIANNTFTYVGTPATKNGIYLVSNGNGGVADITVTGNRVKNFTDGLSLGVAFDPRISGARICSNNVIDSCTTGITATLIAPSVRENVIKSCVNGINVTFGGQCGSVIFEGTMPTTAFAKTYNNFVVRGIRATVSIVNPGASTTYGNILPTPTLFMGEISATLIDNGGINYGTQLQNSSVTGGVWTNNYKVTYSAGAITMADFRISGGNIQTGFVCATPQTLLADVVVSGDYVL